MLSSRARPKEQPRSHNVLLPHPAPAPLARPRRQRPFVAWYGDADFPIVGISVVGAADAVIAFGDPVPFSGADRKMGAKSIE
jgi:hypothetical protein